MLKSLRINFFAYYKRNRWFILLATTILSLSGLLRFYIYLYLLLDSQSPPIDRPLSFNLACMTLPIIMQMLTFIFGFINLKEEMPTAGNMFLPKLSVIEDYSFTLFEEDDENDQNM